MVDWPSDCGAGAKYFLTVDYRQTNGSLDYRSSSVGDFHFFPFNFDLAAILATLPLLQLRFILIEQNLEHFRILFLLFLKARLEASFSICFFIFSTNSKENRRLHIASWDFFAACTADNQIRFRENLGIDWRIFTLWI